jgi:hypothetical protein
MKKISRFRELLSGSVLHNRFEFVAEDAKNEWLRSLGKNDFRHSENVERILDSLVPSEIKSNESFFDPGEIFLLLVSVYLHDIGRATPLLHHELESYKQIKAFPSQFHLKDKFEAEAVAQICAAHASEDVFPIDSCDTNYGIAGLSLTGRPFNLRRLGALLRIADEIDNTYVRVRGIPDQQGSVRNIIRFVNPVPEKGLIEIQADPETWEDWEDLTRVKDYCQKRIREVSQDLEEIGLYYYQVWLNPDSFHVPFKVPPYQKNIDDIVQIIATLAEENYSLVEIFKTIDEFEISILCHDRKFGTVTITGILVYETLNTKEAKSAMGALSYLTQNNLINNWTIVTITKPDTSVKKILRAPGCAVLSLDGLIRNLYDFDAGLARLLNSYKNQPIYRDNLFVNLKASTEKGEEIHDVVEYIRNWVHGDHGIHITLLGDFGSGKTTVSERIAHDLSEDYISNKLERIPILIQLKKVSIGNSIEAAITDVFVNHLKIDMNYNTFAALNKMGKFVLILDGFDEIASAPSEALIVRIFRELDKLSEQNGKIILTCRTHFFKENTAIHELHSGSVLYTAISEKYGYELLFLEPFSHEQIIDYLEKWAGDECEKYIAAINEVYNLSDLATRPVLLNMIAKTIPQIDTSTSPKVNAASLYTLYTNFWLERDDWRSEIKVNDRRRLTIALSTHLFCNEKQYIHYSELPAIVEIISEERFGLSVDAIDYELRTCNFLRRDHRGIYSFVHKSFMEFFLASAFIDQLRNNTNDVNVDWCLFFEKDENKYTNTIIATKETDGFFFQLAEIILNDVDPNKMFSIVRNRHRAHLATTNAILVNKVSTYGIFFALSLLDNNCHTSVDTLVIGLINSQSIQENLNWIADKVRQGITTGLNIDRINEMFDVLSDELDLHSGISLNNLLSSIQNFEEQKDTIDAETLEEGQDYPFTRREKRLQLKKSLKGVGDPDEIKTIRKKFYRTWARDKAIFDQRQEKKKREDRQQELEGNEKRIKGKGKR